MDGTKEYTSPTPSHYVLKVLGIFCPNLIFGFTIQLSKSSPYCFCKQRQIGNETTAEAAVETVYAQGAVSQEPFIFLSFSTPGR
jgi:hypothetical protein